MRLKVWTISIEPSTIEKAPSRAVLIPGGPLLTLNSQRIVRLAAELRVPAMYQTRKFVEDGGLMASGVAFPDLYKRAAIYVDKILKGAQTADSPVELPMKFELFIQFESRQSDRREDPTERAGEGR